MINRDDVQSAGVEGLLFPSWRDAVWSDSALGYKERNLKIRQLAASGDWTYYGIGALFDLHGSTISKIVKES